MANTALSKQLADSYGLPLSRDPQLRTLSIAIVISIVLHAIVLALNFTLPKTDLFNNFSQPLEVVLVNSKTKSRPKHADARAQFNLDGGGNTDVKHVAKSPLPASKKDPQIQLNGRVSHLEEKAKKLMTQIESKRRVDPATDNAQQQNLKADAPDTEELVQRSLELAHLRAQISKDWNDYQKRPRRKFIGARTQEYRFAQYVEEWRQKIERVGTLNYPQEARQQKIYGSLKLTVSIKPDGSVNDIEVNRSSGYKILDAAAIRIVQLSAPFERFPPDIQTDTDILSITRTWTFTLRDELVSE